MKPFYTLFAAAAAVSAMADVTMDVDFSVKSATVRKELHGATYMAAFGDRLTEEYDSSLRELNLQFSRTHDWALANPGQRVVDIHWVFPVFSADADDPANYNFAATDKAIELTKANLGCDIFFRLGNSIDKSDRHYNADMPADNEKWAKVCANIIRHYNCGWANGFYYNIKYWEIWNEPELTSNSCWNGTWAQFQTFFATVIAYLQNEFPKSEYPDWNFGGPALSEYNYSKILGLVQACEKKGALPDFISWHRYGTTIDDVIAKSASTKNSLRAESADYGDIKTVIDEWHYVNWSDSTTANRYNHNSAAFTAACMCGFQNEADSNKFAVACNYGYKLTGSWGVMDSSYNPHRIFYVLKWIGDLITTCTDVCSSTESTGGVVYILAAKSSDGKTGKLLVSHYSSTAGASNININLAGAGATPVITSAYRLSSDSTSPVAVTPTVTDGVLTLAKPAYSTVFYLTFDLTGAED